VLDGSQPTTSNVVVAEKHVRRGRSTSYYLDLPPWGPLDEPNSIKVSQAVYDSTAPGQQVCTARCMRGA
jgi:hypothetical protein